MQQFDQALSSKFVAPAHVSLKNTSSLFQRKLININKKDPDFIADFSYIIDNQSIKDTDESTPDLYNSYLNMELIFYRGPDLPPMSAQLKRLALDFDWEPIGTAHSNPLLDTR